MKTKTLRQTILEALLKHGEMTLDDLTNQLSMNTRGEIFNEITNCKRLGYLTSRKDDVTKMPAYKVTDGGKLYLTESKAPKKVSTEKIPPTKPEKAAKPEVAPAKFLEVEKPGAAPAAGDDLRAQLAQAEKQRDEFFQGLEEAKADVEAKAKRIEKLEAELQYREGVAADLRQKLTEMTSQFNAAQAALMTGEEAVDVKDAAAGYLVRIPKRNPVRDSRVYIAFPYTPSREYVEVQKAEVEA